MSAALASISAAQAAAGRAVNLLGSYWGLLHHQVFMPDKIPPGDADFNTWQLNFITSANANLAALGLVAADMTPLTTGAAAWTAAYTANVTAQAAAMSAREAKDAARKPLEVALRALAARLQASPTVTDARRAALGITVRAKGKQPAGVPTSRPVATVDTSQRLQHSIQFADEASPNKRAKPAGVMGAEIWVKVGDAAPLDVSECQFLALDTATPYVAHYPGTQAGKKAHYLLRWMNTRGAQGPWSETVSATIVG
jgi:hypothetical protein